MGKRNKNIDDVIEQHEIFSPFNIFKRNFEGLREGLSLSMDSTIKAQNRAEAELDRYISKYGETKIIEGKEFFKLHFTRKPKFESLRDNFDNVIEAGNLLPRSIFISMVSQIDLLIASYIRSALEKYPSIISKEKTLSYEEASLFSSIEEMKNHFVDEEIDSVLRASHADHLDWFDRRLGIKLKDLLGDTFKQFIELTERRNLFVHTDGVVSNQYLRVCKKYNCKIDPSVKKGDKLTIDPDYWVSSFICIYEVAVKLSWCFYRKVYPEEIEDIDGFFSNFAIGIVRERPNMAEDFLTFFLGNCEGSRDFERNLLTINLAVSKYVRGKKSEVLDLLGDKDWSSVNSEFSLAVAVLREDYDEACKYMLLIDKKSVLVKQPSYYSDPIYDEFRKTEKFRKVYKKIYREEYITLKN